MKPQTITLVRPAARSGLACRAATGPRPVSMHRRSMPGGS
jgi:hypothetical protein